MGYVVVVFAIINGAALVGLGAYLWYVWRDLPIYVGTAIQDEVRKQDDRIEKRLAKREEAPGNDAGMTNIGATDGMRAGQPWRR